MSATDSDNSIDWLASDNEDNENEQEPDCTRKHSQTEAPLSPCAASHPGPTDSSCRWSSDLKEGDGNWSGVREVSSRGSPGCMEKWDRDTATGLCKTQQGERMNGNNTQQALKRPRGSTEDECKERQLIANMSEKERIFSSKVSASVVHVCFPQTVVDSVSKTSAYPVTQTDSRSGFTECFLHDISSKNDLPLFAIRF